MRDNLGHANIDVTQIVYGNNWWEEPSVGRASKERTDTCHGFPCSPLR